MPSLADANRLFYAALNANLNGDTGPMHAIWSEGADITNTGPFGSRQTGRAAVLAQFDHEAGLGLKGEVTPIDLHLVAAGDMGYAICVESFRFLADGAEVQGTHRATNIFRLEAAGWKLVHHHTDPTPRLEAEV